MKKLINKELIRFEEVLETLINYRNDDCPDYQCLLDMIKSVDMAKNELLRRLNERDELEKENQLLHDRLLSNDKTYKELTECRRLSIVKDDEIMRLAEVIKTYVEQFAAAQKAVEAMEKGVIGK